MHSLLLAHGVALLVAAPSHRRRRRRSRRDLHARARDGAAAARAGGARAARRRRRLVELLGGADWGGVEHCARFLHELAFFTEGSDGAPAPRVALAADHPLETAWVVAHPPARGWSRAGTSTRSRRRPGRRRALGSDPAGVGNDYRPRLGRDSSS
jgi:hypothetical protein